MKFFCGVQATGRGHISRYLVVKEILEREGHEVFGYATGRELPSYAQDIHKFEPGPSFFIQHNRVAVITSTLYNARRIPAYYASVTALANFIREQRFDQAIVDFEPVSARALTRLRQPFTIFDNQTIAFAELPHTAGVQWARRGMSLFVRFYYGSFRQVARILTYSFAPLKPNLRGQQIIPPCVRKEVLNITPSAGEHFLFYSSIGELPAGLVEFAKRNPKVEIRAYVTGLRKTDAPANIVLPGLDSSNFLNDFASCRLFIANAGFESLAEAIYLRKPVVVAPIRGQWEQQINAGLVEEFGIGLAAPDFSLQTFERALRHDKAPSEEVRDWVLHGRDILENALIKSA